MPKEELKEYESHTDKSVKGGGTISSGVKSGDSENELKVIEPLIQHSEIEGLYRAIDPITGWKGWVEYTPPAPEPDPEPEPIESAKTIWRRKVKEYENKQYYVNLGLFTEQEMDLANLKADIISTYDKSYI